MANITNELNTISSGVYGRDIKGAIHSAIDKLNQHGTEGLSDAAANAAVSATKYQSIGAASAEGQEALNWLVENGFMQGGDSFTPMNKDVVRAFIILKRMGLIGNDDSQGGSGYKIYKYYRARAATDQYPADAVKTADPSATGLPPWGRPTIYKLMHKQGTDGKPLFKGSDDPLTGQEHLLTEGSNGTNPPFIKQDGTAATDASPITMYNVEVNVSYDMLRTLVVIDRSGYFENLPWCSSACDP